MAKASSDYIAISKLLRSGYTIRGVNIQMSSNHARANFSLGDSNNKPHNFQSEEDDIVVLGFSWKQIFDKGGNPLHGFVRDTDTFYKGVEYFYDPDGAKVRAAGDRIRRGECSLSFVPHDLIEQFLTDPDSAWKKYLPLREKYYEIVWLHTAQIEEIYKGEQLIRKNSQATLDQLMLIYELMSKAFRQSPNFLKNYQILQSFFVADIYEILKRAGEHIRFAQDQFQMLEKRGGMSIKNGLVYPIDDYASKGEIIIKLMNVLRAAVEIVDGEAAPAPRKKSTLNWDIVRKHPKYGKIVGNFDPRIRHGKSHQSYEIDDHAKVIRFYQDGRIKKLLVEYSFTEFQQMWHDINFILQTIMIALCMEHSVITALMLRSGEFKSLLLGLGNFRPE